MYAPPAEGDDAWLNRWNPFGSHGGQITYNITYASIDGLYKSTQDNGFATLSYLNVFEYGMDVRVPPPPPSKPSPHDYRNATTYLANNFPDAWLQNQGASAAGGSLGLRAWDNGVLMDPGVASYKNEIVAQAQRRMDRIPHFQGVVVDRSDYAHMYNLARDDGVTWAKGNTSFSLKRSYLEAVSAVRDVLGTQRAMLINSAGYVSTTFMRSYDGTFSEGKAVNAVGLLGAGGYVTILWTYSADECCSTPELTDLYFQRRLYLGVYPMAPIPASDHAIDDSNPAANDAYLAYGPLFGALRGKRWSFEPKAVSVTSPETAKANAFVVVRKPAEGPDCRWLFPVVFVETDSFTIEVGGVRAYGETPYFQATFPGRHAGQWQNLTQVEPLSDSGRWRLTVEFGKMNSKSNKSAVVRACL